LSSEIISKHGGELWLGDCLDVLPHLSDKSVDLVLADLPYGTTNCRWDSPIPLDRLWVEYRRVCRGAILLFGQLPFSSILGASNPAMLRYDWVWEKSNPTGHLNAKKSPMRAHESILVFYERQPTYNPIMTSGHKRKTATKRKDVTALYGQQNFDAISYDSTKRYPRSVLRFPSDKQRSNLHPTQKPLALCEYMVRTYTHPGDVVLDNVMGSGTTGVAAVRWARKFIGIESDPQWFDVARNRIAAEPLLTEAAE